MVMLYSFAAACLVGWLSLQANDPVSGVLGFTFALWLFVSGLIATYVVSNRDDD
jgi:hypothetical protein